MMDTPSVRARSGWYSAAMAAVVVALYAPVVGYGFVYDDHWTIPKTNGPIAPLSRVLRALLRGDGARLGLVDRTRPTMVVSTWIDRKLFGLSPLGFHAHSLLLYVLVVLAAWMALRVLLVRPRAALLGALFFAAAPVHAEVVACVNYREDLLVALNGFAILAIVFAPRPSGSPRPRAVEVAVVGVALLLALGAKESALAIPVLVGVVAWARADPFAFVRRREAFFAAFVVVMLVFLNWRISVPDDVPRAHDAGVVARAFATARYEVRATLESFVPFFWSPERAKPAAASAAWLVPFAGLVALVVWLRRTPRGRPFAVALAVALVAPVVSSPLSLPANELADRYLFFGVLGGAIAFGTAVDRALRQSNLVVRRAGAVGALVVLTVAAVTTIRARSVFRSDGDLWQAAVDAAPNSPRAWTGLSRVRRLENRLDDADRASTHALALDPSYAPARLTYVYNLLARGDVVEARAELSVLDDDDHLAGLHRARACARLDADEARACIER
jgi:hypothetical protein